VITRPRAILKVIKGRMRQEISEEKVWFLVESGVDFSHLPNPLIYY
jgi:hypothetical protein